MVFHLFGNLLNPIFQAGPIVTEAETFKRIDQVLILDCEGGKNHV